MIGIREDATDLEVRAGRILADRAAERTGRSVSVGLRDPVVMLTAGEPGLSGEAFAYRPGARAVLAAGEPRALVAAAGRLLRESTFISGNWTLPAAPFTAAPTKPIRPIYFATHFGNWYCHADAADLGRYLEDLALWGYNELVTWFDMHHYRSLEDGAAHWRRLADLDALALSVGMRTGRIAIANESFEGQAPPELRAVGRLEGTGYHTDLCPSIDAARAIVLDDRRAFLELVRDTTALDHLVLWPYDQGGCNCERCTPWPTTYMDLGREIAELTSKICPDVEVIVSAWWIGTHRSGEDDAFFAALERRETWFRTVMCGAVELRRWIAGGRRVPDDYGLLLFPEISMFDALPWGGRGANPAPRRFEAEMRELGPWIAGAMPYSEGRYEDVNKALWAQMQWGLSAEEICEDYCRVSFGVPEAARLVWDLEAGLKDLPTAAGRYEAAKALEARMEPWAADGWRWQVVRARAAFDALRHELETTGSASAEAELRAIYDDLQHRLYLHDAERSLRSWIHLPFDEWVKLPFNELVLPTGG